MRKTIKLNQIYVFLLVTLSIWEFVMPKLYVPFLGEMSLLKVLVLTLVFLVLPRFPFGNSSAKKVFVSFVLMYLYGIISLYWVSSHYYAISRVTNYLVSFLLLFELITLIKNEDYFLFALKSVYYNYVLILILAFVEVVINKYLFYKEYDLLINSFGLRIPIVNQNGPNEMAAVIVCLLPFCMVYLHKDANKRKVLTVLSMCIMILIESRSGILACFIMFILLLFWGQSNSVRKILSFFGLCAVIALVLCFGFGLTDNFKLDYLEDTSRIRIWKKYFQKLVDSNFKGIGMGGVGTGNLGTRYYMTEGSVHNYFLEILVEFGVFGAILFIYNFITSFKNLRVKYVCSEKKDNVSLWMMMFITCYIIISVGASSLRLINAIWMLLGICFAYTIISKNNGKVE